MSLEITTHTQDNTFHLKVSGEIDVSNAEELRGAFEATPKDAVGVVADMAMVSYIDSTGIGVLVGAAHAAENTKRDFSIVSVQKNVRRVFDLLGVSEQLHVSD